MDEHTLSHVDGSGKLQMVDVSAKEPTRRVARARCLVVTAETAAALDAIQPSRLAGIQAAKQTASLIPLCHPLGLDNIQVDVAAHPRGLEVHAAVTTVARTGVEIEALTACAYCALSLLDALEAGGAPSRIAELAVLSKTGGKSDWGQDATRAS